MIRLQKLLAAAGLGSRRTVEEWIRDGRVTIGGRIAQLGDRASPEDEVRLDGRKLELHPAQLSTRKLLLYHKPIGEVTTRSDPQGRPTVFERLPEPGGGRWITVGRLDVNTSGLLLFTTDGELAHRLMHPSSEIEREYLVRVRGRPQPGIIRQLLEGVELDDGTARFDRVTQEMSEGEASEGINTTFRVVLHEGRNREVRRLWQAVGLEVSRLLRVRYGPIELPRDLRPGAARFADANMTERLVAAARGRGTVAGKEAALEQRVGPVTPRGEAVGAEPALARQPRGTIAPESGAARQPRGTIAPESRAARQSRGTIALEPGAARQSPGAIGPKRAMDGLRWAEVEAKSGTAATQTPSMVEPKSGAAAIQPPVVVEPRSRAPTQLSGARKPESRAERPWEAAERRRAAAERPGARNPKRPKRKPEPRK